MKNKLTMIIPFLIIALAVVADFIFLFPVDVLRDFAIHVPEKTYRRGDLIVYESSFTKIHQVAGYSTRSILCGNVDYPVNNAHGTRQPGKKGGKVRLTIPEQIPSGSKCRVHVVVDYKVYYFRPFSEDAKSNEFTIL